MKISTLKRNEIKCLVIEDFEQQKVFKVYDKEEIREAIKKYSDMEIVKVYNPNNETKKMIYDLMDRQAEKNKVKSKIKELDMLLKVIPMLTDIEIDLDLEEDKDKIEEIIVNPNEVFDKALDEVNKIILQLNLDWIDNLKLLGQLPDDVLNALVEMKRDTE